MISPFARRLGAALAVLLLSGTAFAQVKSPAELLPAETLAYLEVHQPAKITREVAALLKGSALEDIAATMTKFRSKHARGDQYFFAGMEVSTLGVFLGPEMLAEAGRFEGAAVALTGVSKDGPEVVAVLLTGTSNFPALYVRSYVALSGETRGGEEVEGVMIYRSVRRIYTAPPPGQPGKVNATEGDPSYALLPGAVLIGNFNAVKEAVRRFKGKNADPGLTSISLYKAMTKDRDRPGLYGFVDYAGLAGQMDSALKGIDTPDALALRAFTAAVNPKAVRHLTAALTLSDGNANLSARVTLDPKQANPLLEILGDQKPGLEALHGVPANAVVAVSMNMKKAETQWAKLLEQLDVAARAAGVGDSDLPSKGLTAAAERVKLDIGKDVAAKLAHVTFALEPHRFRPMILVTARDEDGAKSFQEDALPKLAALLRWQTDLDKVKPTEVKVLGQKLLAIPFANPTGDAMITGRDGATVIIGFDGSSVAGAVVNASKKEGLSADRRVADALKEFDSPVLTGTLSLGQLIAGMVGEMEAPPRVIYKRPVGPGGGPPPQPEKPGPREESKGLKELRKAVEPMPKGVLALTRKEGTVALEVRCNDLRKASAQLLNAMVEAVLELSVQRYGGFGTIEVDPGKGDVPPPPPPPQ